MGPPNADERRFVNRKEHDPVASDRIDARYATTKIVRTSFLKSQDASLLYVLGSRRANRTCSLAQAAVAGKRSRQALAICCLCWIKTECFHKQAVFVDADFDVRLEQQF